MLSLNVLTLTGPYRPLVLTAIIFALGTVVYLLVRQAIRRIRDPKARITISRVAGAVIVFFILIATLGVWINNTTVFLLVAGLVSAGIAFSLQGPLTSLMAWFVLLVLKPFEIGDRVKSGEVAGDVVGFNPFFFHLLEIGDWSDGDLYTGRLVEVPNSQIMSQPLYNYSRNFGFLWDTVVVGVYYEADWARAQSIALSIAERYSEPARATAQKDLERFREEHFMPRGRLDPQVFVSMASTTINLTIRYITDVWQRQRTRSQIAEEVLRKFAAVGIDIAYPSVVVRGPDGPVEPSFHVVPPPGPTRPSPPAGG